jgi:hypothetical protein
MERAMMTKSSMAPRHGGMNAWRALGLALLMLAVAALPGVGRAEDAHQTMFASPDEAAKALIDAADKGDTDALMAIFGPQGSDLVSSGDPVADKSGRERFVASAKQATRLEKVGDDKVILNIGRDDWPLPIPIVRGTGGWYFDTAAGEEEIINRRIGRNELGAIDVCRAYVAAQREYASKDHDGSGVLKFAQRVNSSPNRKDGLYWPAAADGSDLSPLGPLVADAIKEGYTKQEGARTPYHGYYFKILRAQGKAAPGGDYEYVINGNMIAGFALVAWPASYGASGVMTFIVNQQGIVYQKDLGEKTDEVASVMTRYDPDATWQKVE